MHLPAAWIYAMLHNYKPMDMVNFAVASSAIKHTIHGDANITDDVFTIRNLDGHELRYQALRISLFSAVPQNGAAGCGFAAPFLYGGKIGLEPFKNVQTLHPVL